MAKTTVFCIPTDSAFLTACFSFLKLLLYSFFQPQISVLKMLAHTKCFVLNQQNRVHVEIVKLMRLTATVCLILA